MSKKEDVYAQTESLTESPTEFQTEAQTESLTEFQTEALTEFQTEAPTEFQTEAPTEFQTESPTESHSFKRDICSSVGLLTIGNSNGFTMGLIIRGLTTFLKSRLLTHSST